MEKNILCSLFGRTNIVKISILTKEINTFNAIPIKIPKPLFTELEQSIIKFVWNHKRPWIAKVMLKKKTEARKTRIPDFKTLLQSYNHQDSMVLAQKKTPRLME